MIARLVRSADFERVLRTRTRAASAHFALHHVPERPSAPWRPAGPPADELSTAGKPALNMAVDDCAPGALWLGLVVPKRHARRSVTRSLLKRQIRHAFAAGEAGLARGLWVVRVRAPFDAAAFTSAASAALKRAARAELDQLLASAARRA